MNYCPISLEPLADGESYSQEGLRSLHPRLASLQALALTEEEQLREARLRADKMSVQGVQPKLSAVLRPSTGVLEVVDCGGQYILKPNPQPFEEVPANEAVTMQMAKAAGIEVPPCGLVPAVDGSWVYLIKRFDRVGRKGKRHVEDFAQLLGATRDTKYESSLEKVGRVVEEHCSFPALEKLKLARRLLFCFLIGNEDMHLKNFSLWMDGDIVSLSPAYDLLNTTLVLEDAIEESALPLAGKKRKLTPELWIDYFCSDRLGLQRAHVVELLDGFSDVLHEWEELLKKSYLSNERQERYRALLRERAEVLGLVGAEN